MDNYNLNNIKRVNLITQVKQKGWAIQSVFNKTGSIMVSGCGNKIRIWNLNVKPKQLRKLSKHNGRILCIAISKKIFWFVSGDLDGVMMSWNELCINKRVQQKHRDGLTTILLNRNENELISCSIDQTIKVWKVDCQGNQIQFEYELEKQHQADIYCLSLNESESYLVSCSEDETIILWEKKENKWKFMIKLQTQQVNYQICFITNSLFAYEPNNNTKSEIVEIKNGELLFRPELKFQIMKEISPSGSWFPILYNQNKQIIIQIHMGKIYFFKMLNDRIQSIYNPLICPHKDDFCCQTSLSGEILVTGSDDQELYRIYKIQ